MPVTVDRPALGVVARPGAICPVCKRAYWQVRNQHIRHAGKVRRVWMHRVVNPVTRRASCFGEWRSA